MILNLYYELNFHKNTFLTIKYRRKFCNFLFIDCIRKYAVHNFVTYEKVNNWIFEWDRSRPKKIIQKDYLTIIIYVNSNGLFYLPILSPQFYYKTSWLAVSWCLPSQQWNTSRFSKFHAQKLFIGLCRAY